MKTREINKLDGMSMLTTQFVLRLLYTIDLRYKLFQALNILVEVYIMCSIRQFLNGFHYIVSKGECDGECRTKGVRVDVAHNVASSSLATLPERILSLATEKEVYPLLGLVAEIYYPLHPYQG